MIYPSGQVIKIIQNCCNWNAKIIRKVSTDGITGLVSEEVSTTEEPDVGKAKKKHATGKPQMFKVSR